MWFADSRCGIGDEATYCHKQDCARVRTGAAFITFYKSRLRDARIRELVYDITGPNEQPPTRLDFDFGYQLQGGAKNEHALRHSSVLDPTSIKRSPLCTGSNGRHRRY